MLLLNRHSVHKVLFITNAGKNLLNPRIDKLSFVKQNLKLFNVVTAEKNTVDNSNINVVILSQTDSGNGDN